MGWEYWGNALETHALGRVFIRSDNKYFRIIWPQNLVLTDHILNVQNIPVTKAQTLGKQCQISLIINLINNTSVQFNSSI